MNDPNLTQEELDDRLLQLGIMNEDAILGLAKDGNFQTFGNAEAAASTLAGVMLTTTSSPEAALTIGLKSREGIIDVVKVQ